jgi:gluconate kinase
MERALDLRCLTGKKGENMKSSEKTIYIISGPCGAGKSTVAQIVAHNVQQSALIKGDDLLHMYEQGSEPPWDERLTIMWKNILSLTRNLLQHEYNVIIDTVVEHELEWFCRHFAYTGVRIKYVVLRADDKILIERLNQRGDPYLIERSLFLLNQLENFPSNQPHLYDTTHKQPSEIANDIVHRSDFLLVFS